MSSISAGTTSTTTLIHSGDTTGSLVFKTNDTGSGGTTAMTIDTSQNLQFNSGYGSVATAYGCRAWVNFDGTTSSPCTIRASANVTSVTKNTTGVYTVNFTNAMPDANYAVSAITQYDQSGNQATHNLMAPEITNSSNAMQTGSVSVSGKYGPNNSTYDMTTFCVAIFR